MSAEYNARCDRIDARFRRAHELVEMWTNGNRDHVMRTLSFAGNRRTGKAAARMVAAIGWKAATGTLDRAQQIAVGEILEAIAREKDR